MVVNIGVGLLLMSLGIIGVVYGIYSTAVLWGKSYHSPGRLISPKPISIIIPAYNEEKVIVNKIKNLSEIDYPSELMEVIIIDDCSEDNTRQKAIEAFEQYHIKGKVLTNQYRQGTNANYNRGFELAIHDLVVTTDADVTFEKNALRYLLNVLINEGETGAVCGELIPCIEGQSLSTGIEGPYRDVFGKICGWESHLHSTYCFNGPLIALKRGAIDRISPAKGASDTNMALMAILKGYHARYVPEAKFYEWIAMSHLQQKRQKIRRAARLLESTWSARQCLFNKKFGKFGMIVLPLRFAMLMIVPFLFFFSILLALPISFIMHPLVGILVLLFILFLFGSARWSHNMPSSFAWHQYYLLMGLFRMARPAHIWESIDRRRIGN